MLRVKCSAVLPLTAIAVFLSAGVWPGTSNASPAAAAAEAAPSLSLRLKPVADPQGSPLRLEVGLRFDSSLVPAGSPLLELPLVSGNLVTAAGDISALTARDDAGPLPLTQRDQGEGPGGKRQWIAARPVSGQIVVGYSVPAVGRTGERGPGTPVELRSDGSAVSGSASVFLLLPTGDGNYRLSLEWDLASMPAGSRSLSSFGPGNVKPGQPVALSALRSAYFMAGRIGIEPSPPASRGFNAAWQGETPFAAAPLMQWTGSLYEHYSKLFNRTADQPYSVFVRFNPLNAGGGVGQYRSFVLTYKDEWPANDEAWLKFVLAHEMYHTFQPHVEGAAGSMETSWFNEGTAVFYAWTLPFRFRLSGPDYLLEQINMSAMRYYTSARADATNAEVAKGFWADTRLRMLAYDRSAFYFARVDKQLRGASQGKRSLDDLMLILSERAGRGEKLGADDWETLITAELGVGAAEDFRAMLAGKLQLPDSDSFGNCLRRTSVSLRRYELGFDPNVLVEPDRIIRGVVPGSEAEKAGLRNGDYLVRPVPQDIAASSQNLRLTLPLRRGDREFEITYLPRGEAVQTPQWERVPGVTDAECRI